MRYRLLIFKIFILFIFSSCYKVEESNVPNYSELDCHISTILSSDGSSWSYLYNSSGQVIKFGAFDFSNSNVFIINRDSNLKVKFSNGSQTSISTYTKNQDTIRCIKIENRPNDTSVIFYILVDNLIRYCKYSDKFGNNYIDTFEYKDNNLTKYKLSQNKETYTYEYFNDSFFKDTIGNKIYKVNYLLPVGNLDLFLVINDFFKLNCKSKNIGKCKFLINNKLEHTYELNKNKTQLNSLYFVVDLIHKYSKTDTSTINLNCY